LSTLIPTCHRRLLSPDATAGTPSPRPENGTARSILGSHFLILILRAFLEGHSIVHINKKIASISHQRLKSAELLTDCPTYATMERCRVRSSSYAAVKRASFPTHAAGGTSIARLVVTRNRLDESPLQPFATCSATKVTTLRKETHHVKRRSFDRQALRLPFRRHVLLWAIWSR